MYKGYDLDTLAQEIEAELYPGQVPISSTGNSNIIIPLRELTNENTKQQDDDIYIPTIPSQKRSKIRIFRWISYCDGVMEDCQNVTKEWKVLDFIDSVLRGVAQVVFMNNPITAKNLTIFFKV
jgi:hypothetical protein